MREPPATIEARIAITAILVEVLQEKAFQLPIHVAMVGANGSTIVFRYTGGGDQELEARVLVEYADNGIFTWPINLMVVDTDGNALLRWLPRPPPERVN